MRRKESILTEKKGLLLLLLAFFLPEIFVSDNMLDTTVTDDPSGFSECSDMASPKFEGGSIAFNKYLKEHLKYPGKAYAERREGLVLVSCMVGADRTVSDVRAFKSPNPDMGNEAIRLIESTNGLWIPAKRNGQDVAALKYIPVPFHLDKVQIPEVKGKAGNKELIKYIVAALLFVAVLFYLKKRQG